VDSIKDVKDDMATQVSAVRAKYLAEERKIGIDRRATLDRFESGIINVIDREVNEMDLTQDVMDVTATPSGHGSASRLQEPIRSESSGS
jgi:hypothetical protein